VISWYELIGSFAVAYLTHFVAEDYRGFKRGSALAAALAGELKSYLEGSREFEKAAPELRSLLATETPMHMPDTRTGSHRVFEAGVSDLGLLGLKTSESVAYVYQQIDAFRSVWKALCIAPPSLQANLLEGALTCIRRATERGEPLIEDLELRARASYPWMPPGGLAQMGRRLFALACVVWLPIGFFLGNAYRLKNGDAAKKWFNLCVANDWHLSDSCSDVFANSYAVSTSWHYGFGAAFAVLAPAAAWIAFRILVSVTSWTWYGFRRKKKSPQRVKSSDAPPATAVGRSVA
jgi:hypothetical protein